MKKKLTVLGVILAMLCAIPAFAGKARLFRVVMKDKSEKIFLVEQVTKISVFASSLDTEGLPKSNSSVSSSSAKTEVSSSSAKTEASSSSKKADTSSSSKNAEVSSSSKKSETSSSSKKSETSSSSKKKETSSSSKSKDAIITMNPRNLRATWNAQQQAVLLYSNQSTAAKIFVFDAQGVRIANLHQFITQGTNSIPLAPLNLANGKYVLLVEANHTHTKNIITIDNASK